MEGNQTGSGEVGLKTLLAELGRECNNVVTPGEGWTRIHLLSSKEADDDDEEEVMITL